MMPKEACSATVKMVNTMKLNLSHNEFHNHYDDNSTILFP